MTDTPENPDQNAVGERQPKVVRRQEWAKTPDGWKGHVAGVDLGTGVTILFYESLEVGVGPKLHVHTYDEIFLVREGRGRFTVGDTTIDAAAGDVVLGPANIPHKFHNLGPGPLRTTDIHLNDRWIQTDLDDPDA